MTSRLPANIRVASNQDYNPASLSIIDAVTGETVQGIMTIHTQLSRDVMELDVYHTRNWPTQKEDMAINLREADWEELPEETIILKGLVCVRTKYHLKVWDVEARR